MGRAKDAAAVTLAVGVFAGSINDAYAAHGSHHEHTPGTYYGTMGPTPTSAAAFGTSDAPSDWPLFRASYAHALETLTDETSARLPRSSITFVLA
jgi:hypothetical protein